MNPKRAIRIKAPQVIPAEHTVPTSLMLTEMSDEERRAHVWERRLKGYSYEAIAREMREAFAPSSLPKNWGPKQVYADCAAILAQIRDEYSENAAEAVNIELGRFDELLNAVWENAKAGDVRSVQVALDISRERRKMLGLDSPERFQVDWRVQVVELFFFFFVTPQEIAAEFGDEGLGEVNRLMLEMKG